MNWNILDNTKQISELRKLSHEKHVVIFKHSTSCYISSMVLKQFEKGFNVDLLKEKSEFYFLDLIKYRAVSNHIANEFGIRHESPQVLVVRDGKVIHHSSHSRIQPEQIEPILI